MPLSHLRMVNGIVGLCLRDELPGWPNSLAALGFDVSSIEGKFVDASHQTINPDVILVSAPENGSLLFECKEGVWQHESAEQAHRYAGLDVRVLVRNAGISVRDFGTHQHGTVYFCNTAHVACFAQGLQSHRALGLIAFDQNGHGLRANQIGVQAAHRLFDRGIPADEGQCPTELVPFTGESVQESEGELALAEALINALIVVMHDETVSRNVELETLLDCALPYGLWRCFGRDEKRAIRNRAKKLMIEICQTELSVYFQRRGGPGSNPPTYEIVDSPLSYPSNLRTQKLQALQRRKDAFLARKEQGGAYKGFDPRQRELWEGQSGEQDGQQ